MATQCSPYHSVDQKVHHIYSDCTSGNNIEPDKRRSGTGHLPLCERCKDIRAGKLSR